MVHIAKKNTPKKVKGDSPNVKHIKLKLHNFRHEPFYISIYNFSFILIHSRYTLMLCCARQASEKREKITFRVKLITGWQFNKFLRSLREEEENNNFELIFLCINIYTCRFYTQVSLLNEIFRIQPDLFNRFSSIERDFKPKFFDLFTHHLKCTIH